jgi:hypothetical protein
LRFPVGIDEPLRGDVGRERRWRVASNPPPLTASKLKLPTFRKDHLLKGNAVDALGVTHERDFPVLGGAGMLVGYHSPIRSTVLRHGNHERIGTIDAFVRLPVL